MTDPDIRNNQIHMMCTEYTVQEEEKDSFGCKIIKK